MFGRDDTEFNEALHHVAFGVLEKVQAVLDKANSEQDKTKLKALFLSSGTTVSPAGITVKHTTLLECALGSGDPEMIEMIKSYFSKFEGGEEEKERQLERYRPCIEAMEEQKPDDLTWLIKIIKNSSLKDVAAELATDDKYDPSHKSQLRDALNKFRVKKLDPKVRVITKPRMHYNYKNLIHAYKLLYAEWGNLQEGGSFERIYLIARQIISFIGLVELPAYERYVFARNQFKQATKGKKIERTFKYKYDSGSFPALDEVHSMSLSGAGFDSYVSIYDCLPRTVDSCEAVGPDALSKLMTSKNIRLAELIQRHPKPKIGWWW